jgi:heavy metal translocating P-type ATPase
VDGEVVHGEATVDQRAVTGESAPILLAKGDAAWAATAVVDGQLRLRAIRTGLDTAAAQIARLVENAPVGDTRIQNYAELWADRLVIPTLALAIVAACLTGDHRYLLSVLVVDFGTGVRVAAPITVLSSMIEAARAGIAFKSGSQLEQLGAVDTVIFDKTGTLTTGAPEVAGIISYDRRFSAPKLIALSASVEARSRHPIAAAIRAEPDKLSLSLPACRSVDYVVGRGVVGRAEQVQIWVGSQRFMQESGVDLETSAADWARLDAQGCSRVFIAIKGKLAGLISVRDKIRAESAATIRRLRDLGIREIILLSGDTEWAARSLASQLGVHRYFATASPVEKVDFVQRLQREGRVVAMVGDGMNDGPALRYANVGIAVKHGAELAHESAGVLLTDSSLAGLVKAIEIARSSLARIKWGYAIVGVWNLQALLLALTGMVISPAATALVSDGSAIFAGIYGMQPLWRRRAARS